MNEKSENPLSAGKRKNTKFLKEKGDKTKTIEERAKKRKKNQERVFGLPEGTLERECCLTGIDCWGGRRRVVRLMVMSLLTFGTESFGLARS